MRIVLVTRFYPPDTGGGGIAAYARYLALGLRCAGHPVRVISRMVPGSEPRRLVEGIEVFRLQPPEIPYRYHRVPLAGRYLRFLNDLGYAWAVRRKLLELSEAQPPDIVEYADIDAEGLFHPSEVAPAVVKLHTPHFILRRYYSGAELPYDTATVGHLERLFIRQASGLSSPSRYLASAVAEECGLPETDIAYVPNMIDASFFAPQNGEDDELPMVLYVGRLEHRKGVWVFAKSIPIVARRAPNARFVFLGRDGCDARGRSQKAALHQYLESEGVAHCVEFHGDASPDVFLDHYCRATVCVMPSLFENCPYTLLEAMSCARPVVVSRAYGMAEMIADGESGLFFEPENAEHLAEQAIRLLERPALRAELGAGARAKVLRDYSLEVGTEKTLAFYKAVLSRQGSRCASS